MATDVTEQASKMNRSTKSERRTKDSISVAKQEWLIAIGSGLLLWAAFPPIGCWPLAFFAPVGWIRLAKNEDATGKRYFKILYCAGFIHWMLLVHWIRIPHVLNNIGWIVLAGYLAIYLPIFVVATRTMVCRWKIPSVFAAPIVWTSLELARGYLFTGFSISLVGHALSQQTTLIQIADIFGAYGVSFIVIAVAAGIAELFPTKPAKMKLWPLGFASLLIVMSIVYGDLRRKDSFEITNGKEPTTIALIQGVYDTVFGNDQEQDQIADVRAFADYQRLSEEAIVENDMIDLIVWPESMFSTRYPVVRFSEPLLPAPGSSLTAKELSEIQNLHQFDVEFISALLKTPMLVGSERYYQERDQIQRFNSALLISTDGKFKSVYDKNHPVMFGEYIPFGKIAPWLYTLTPMGTGLNAGTQPASVEIEKIRIAPCICFENTIPHLIRRQTAELRNQNESPDCLVTITNDGWFWGSSLLDVHFACGVFRAIEMRLPMLIAANTGFSGWIDAKGQVLAKGGRREESVVLSEIFPATKEMTIYQSLGDSPFVLFTVLTMLAILDAYRQSIKSKS